MMTDNGYTVPRPGDGASGPPSGCDSCEHYDVISDDGTMGCTADMDEDELYSLITGRNSCPMYKYYDEYKSVRKQN